MTARLRLVAPAAPRHRSRPMPPATIVACVRAGRLTDWGAVLPADAETVHALIEQGRIAEDNGRLFVPVPDEARRARLIEIESTAIDALVDAVNGLRCDDALAGEDEASWRAREAFADVAIALQVARKRVRAAMAAEGEG